MLLVWSKKKTIANKEIQRKGGVKEVELTNKTECNAIWMTISSNYLHLPPHIKPLHNTYILQTTTDPECPIIIATTQSLAIKILEFLSTSFWVKHTIKKNNIKL